ncbi:MAG: SCP2 sterol-binding domain-containing protein [Actinomycetota bacterium]|nr:SCP2 sterol-binding domain-containing protein [Actinomycetota bacterium]
MSAFLSPAWLGELAEAAAASDGLRRAAGGVVLTVAHRVTGGPQGDVEYRVRFRDGAIEVLSGPGPCDVTVEQPYATAAAISRGELAPSEAFATGQLRLGGQPRLLADHREVFAQLDDVFATVRATTSY